MERSFLLTLVEKRENVVCIISTLKLDTTHSSWRWWLSHQRVEAQLCLFLIDKRAQILSKKPTSKSDFFVGSMLNLLLFTKGRT